MYILQTMSVLDTLTIWGGQFHQELIIYQQRYDTVMAIKMYIYTKNLKIGKSNNSKVIASKNSKEPKQSSQNKPRLLIPDGDVT